MTAMRLPSEDLPCSAPRSDSELLAPLLAIRGFGVLAIDTDGRIVVGNEAAEQIMGRPRAELMGKRTHELAELRVGGLILPADRLPSQVAMRTKLAQDAGVMELRRKDGVRRWLRVEATPMLDGAGDVDRVLVLMLDVTVSREAEEALRAERRKLARSGDRFRRVLESVPDAIAVYHEHGFGYANAALVSLFGYGSGAELVGKEVTRVLPGHTPWTRALGNPASALREESWRRVDGSIAVVEIATHGIDLDGAEGTLLIARDVSERKRAQRELVQSTRLASVGTLAAGVAHEINNPLTYVIANLDMMSEALQRPVPDTTPECILDILSMVEDARAGAESVRKIVRGLKIFSRADEERRVTLDVRKVIDASVQIAFNEIRHRATLVVDYRDIPKIDADEGRLGQVFINLLVNAAQAIPEGHVAANQIRVVTTTDDEGRAVIEVHDTGTGIPPEVLERIFDPFFTTKPIGIGTGLGLSICHGLITELGGELRVESVVGQGTTFRVVLPAATLAPPPSLATPPATALPSDARRARVMVIDDDVTVAEAVRKVLARDHEVTVVNSAKKGLQRIAEGPVFDVILCDLMMPEMTGMSFHAELLATHPELARRVVFITGGAFSTGAEAFLDTVENGRVDKPFDLVALRALVRELAEKSD